LLALGAVGHLFGTFQVFEFGRGPFVWSLSGVLAAGLLVALNVLRNARPEDKTLAGVVLVGNVGWLGIVILFGQSLGNYLDFRVLFHAVSAAGLACFSVKSLFCERKIRV
jgi:hypothetical protein